MRAQARDGFRPRPGHNAEGNGDIYLAVNLYGIAFYQRVKGRRHGTIHGVFDGYAGIIGLPGAHGRHRRRWRVHRQGLYGLPTRFPLGGEFVHGGLRERTGGA